MALTANSLRWYCAADMPEDDASAVGGAISLTARPLDDQFAAAAVPEIISDNAADTMNVTITGRTASGGLDSETKALNGTTAVAFATTFERITKIVLASVAAGTVLLKQGVGGTTRHTVNPGELQGRMLFPNASAEALGGAVVVRYEKVFVKNIDADEDALAPSIELTTDPSTLYDLRPEDAVDDNNAAANRLAEPAGNGGAWGNGPHSVPGTDLGFGKALGVWVRQTLAAGQAAALDALQITTGFSDA